MTKISDLHKEWMEDPEYRQAYEEMRPEFELASANIFAQLGLDGAEDLHERAIVGSKVVKLLRERGELVERTGIEQDALAHLMNGHFDLFTTDELRGLLSRVEGK